MANLVQVAEELEYVPKDQLVEMSQNPDSRYPQYLVLSEIQRRTQMEKMYRAQEASMNQPETTVAEEVVADFAQPQGLAGMNAEGPANAGDFSPPAMPATPMQMAASGGRTGYANFGSTSNPMNFAMQQANTRRQLLESLGIDPTGMSEEEIQKALQFAQSAPIEQEQLPTVDTGVNQPVDLQTFGAPPIPFDVSQIVDTPPIPFDVSQVVDTPDTVDRGLSSAVPEVNIPEVDEAGTIDPADIPEEDRKGLIAWAKENPGEAALIGLDAAALYLLVAPVPGARIAAGVTKALAWTGRGIKGLKAAYQAKKAKSLQSIGRRTQAKAAEKGLDGKKLITQGSGSSKNLPTPPGYWESWGRTGLKAMRIPQRIVAGGIAIPTSVALYNWMTDDEVIESKDKEQEIVETTQDKLNKLLADINKTQDTGTTEKKGLASFLPQAEGLDIAQLGGIIMGARNMSELGAGIAGLAGSIQDRRTKEKLTDIQGNLYKAQTAKYEADVEMMEPNQLIDVMKNLEDMMKLDMESGQGENVAQYQAQYEAAYKRYAELMGIPYTTEAERMQQAADRARVQ